MEHTIEVEAVEVEITINLTATETNGANSFLLLNGFELFQTATP